MAVASLRKYFDPHPEITPYFDDLFSRWERTIDAQIFTRKVGCIWDKSFPELRFCVAYGQPRLKWEKRRLNLIPSQYLPFIAGPEKGAFDRFDLCIFHHELMHIYQAFVGMPSTEREDDYEDSREHHAIVGTVGLPGENAIRSTLRLRYRQSYKAYTWEKAEALAIDTRKEPMGLRIKTFRSLLRYYEMSSDEICAFYRKNGIEIDGVNFERALRKCRNPDAAKAAFMALGLFDRETESPSSVGELLYSG